MNKLKLLCIPLFIGSLFLSSCKNEINDINCTVINIKDAKDIGRKHVLDDIIEKIEFIPLAFNEEFPIGYTQLITFCNNRFYICDHRSGTIHVFDEEGNYINVFDKHGRGPGEILELKGFFVHDNSNLSVLTYQKIVTYDENFNFLNSFKIPDNGGQVADFVFMNEHNYILFNNLVGEKNIAVFEQDNLVSEYGNIKAQDTRKKRFYKYGNTYNIIPLFYSNSILTINNNLEIFEKFKLLIGEQNFKGHSTLNSKNSQSDINNYGINHFFETKKYIYGTYGNGPVKSFLYNKESQKCIKSKMGITQHGGELRLPIHNISSEGNFMVGIISSIAMERYLNKLRPDNVLSDNEIEKIENRDVADNPIIIKIKLKS